MISNTTNCQLSTVSMPNPCTVLPPGGLEKEHHCCYLSHLLSQHPAPSWGLCRPQPVAMGTKITVFFQWEPTVVAFKLLQFISNDSTAFSWYAQKRIGYMVRKLCCIKRTWPPAAVNGVKDHVHIYTWTLENSLVRVLLLVCAQYVYHGYVFRCCQKTDLFAWGLTGWKS